MFYKIIKTVLAIPGKSCIFIFFSVAILQFVLHFIRHHVFCIVVNRTFTLKFFFSWVSREPSVSSNRIRLMHLKSEVLVVSCVRKVKVLRWRSERDERNWFKHKCTTSAQEHFHYSRRRVYFESRQSQKAWITYGLVNSSLVPSRKSHIQSLLLTLTIFRTLV